MIILATYISSTEFSLTGDYTEQFHAGRRVKSDCGVDGYKYGTIESSSYDGTSDTTVNLDSGSDSLTVNLVSVQFGIIGKGTNQSMPIHAHDGTEGSGGSLSSTSLPMAYLAGLEVSNNSSDTNNDIDFGVGECRDTGDSADLRLTSILTKQIDAAWAAGTNQGGLFSGSVASDTTYHLFIIKNPTTGVVDAGFDTDVDASNRPAAYTAYRRVASLYTDGSGNLVQFSQKGNEFLLNSLSRQTNQNPGTSAVLQTQPVPLGLKVLAKVVVFFVDLSPSSAVYIIVTSPDQNDIDPSSTSDFSVFTSSERGQIIDNIRTNISGQIRFRVSASNTDVYVFTTCHGWIDDRGFI